MNDNLTWPSTVKWDNSISTTIDSNCITTSSNTGSYYYDESSPNPNEWQYIPTPTGILTPIINKKGDDDMRYLYEVILVNPKNDTFMVEQVIAKSETSALMKAFYESGFETGAKSVPFDDLKTQCRVLMEWKKEKSLEKALETIKKAVE